VFKYRSHVIRKTPSLRLRLRLLGLIQEFTWCAFGAPLMLVWCVLDACLVRLKS
jgi:hypothetical protein